MLIDNGRNGYDDVRGIIIGGDYISWQLFYDGRPQGQKEYADTEYEGEEAAKEKCAELKAQYQGYPCYLYPDDSKWEIRIWN